MAKRIVVLASLVIFVVGLSGCATARKQKELEIQGLKNQITVLESQLQSKDEEMGSLRETISRQQEKAAQDVIKKSGSKKKVIAEAKSRPKTKQIQVALKNGGFYTGAVDGKKGRQTREAIRAFQRANNLNVTGKADKSTWALLKSYLYKKEK